MPLHVSSTCAHHQEVKIALHSLWYHHTYRWLSRARDPVRRFLLGVGGFVKDTVFVPPLPAIPQIFATVSPLLWLWSTVIC